MKRAAVVHHMLFDGNYGSPCGSDAALYAPSRERQPDQEFEQGTSYSEENILDKGVYPPKISRQ